MVLHLGTSCLGCNMSIPPTCNMHIIRAVRSQTTHLACHHPPASSHHLPLSVSALHHLAQYHHPSALHLQNHMQNQTFLNNYSSNIVFSQKFVRQCLESAWWQVYADVLCNYNAIAKTGMYKSQAGLSIASMANNADGGDDKTLIGMTSCYNAAKGTDLSDRCLNHHPCLHPHQTDHTLAWEAQPVQPCLSHPWVAEGQCSPAWALYSHPHPHHLNQSSHTCIATSQVNAVSSGNTGGTACQSCVVRQLCSCERCFFR